MVAVALWLAHPLRWTVLAGSVIAFLGLAIRAVAAGYLRKRETLAVSGPYAYTRNPLYFGSVLMALGLALATGSWVAVVLVAAYVAAFYPMVMRREEAELREQFGEPYEAYARAVPMFWPRLSVTESARDGSQFCFAQYMRNREYRAAIGYVLLVAAFAAIGLWRNSL